MTASPRIHDYDKDGQATYRQDFWEQANRDYEDRVERIALRRLLHPPIGNRLIEFGAGFGRLSNFFTGYKQVILVDYAKSQLEDARSRLGDGKFLYVAANLYALPFADGIADAATLIRVLHHLADAQAALAQIRATLAPGATFILEYANKRNLKAMLRHALGRQTWSPYDESPVEFVELHFDFHPNDIQRKLSTADFILLRSLAVSYFRLNLLKKWVPLPLLTQADAWLQPSGLLYSPSIFTQNQVPGERPATLPTQLFKCPQCQHIPLLDDGDTIYCEACQQRWSCANGIYDFRQPLAP